MQKIMFDDKYSLTQAVLGGRKTMTRRIIKTPRTMEGKDVYGFSVVKYPRTGVPIEVMALDADGAQINNILPKYNVGEVVAVAQKYSDFRWPSPQRSDFQEILHSAGWKNKMFVRADIMPHQIRIKNVRVERIQYISDEDCLKEGIIEYAPCCECGSELYSFDGSDDAWYTPREAFAALIKKMYGKKTWDNNPWVFVYEFELLK